MQRRLVPWLCFQALSGDRNEHFTVDSRRDSSNVADVFLYAIQMPQRSTAGYKHAQPGRVAQQRIDERAQAIRIALLKVLRIVQYNQRLRRVDRPCQRQVTWAPFRAEAKQ